MELAFAEITEDDLPALTRVMTRAFDDDARKHLGLERGGPPGYDSGDFFREWLFPYKESRGYKIMLDGELVGAFIVWILPEGNNVLGTIFVDPDYQDKGIGTQAWNFIETSFPETKSWMLGTPSWATKNHYFYEAKCGFHKAREEETPGESWPTYVYEKDMRAE
jgi:GNAT superfamily N-acetyltransferase